MADRQKKDRQMDIRSEQEMIGKVSTKHTDIFKHPMANPANSVQDAQLTEQQAIGWTYGRNNSCQRE